MKEENPCDCGYGHLGHLSGCPGIQYDEEQFQKRCAEIDQPPARQEGETPRTEDHFASIVDVGRRASGSTPDFCRTLERELFAKQAEVERLRKESNDWRTKFLTQRDEANIKTWIWMGDGEDHPESLACPVIMSADQLREFVSYQADLESLKAEQGWRSENKG